MKIRIGRGLKSVGNAALSLAVTTVLQMVVDAATKRLVERRQRQLGVIPTTPA